MHRHTAAAMLSIALGVLAGGGPPAVATPTLEKDLRVLLDMLTGRFDNQEQVYFQGQPGGAGPAVPRTHVILRQVEAPALAGRALLERRFTDDDPAKATVPGVHAFTVDAAAGAIRQTLHGFADAAQAERAAASPESLKGLTSEAFRSTPACDILWRPQGAQFVGAVAEPDVCPAARAGGTTVAGPGLLWLPGPDATPLKLRKARAFTCWMAIRTGEGPRDWQMLRNLVLHDQGGMAWGRTDGDKAIRLGFKMRNVVWPSGPQEDSLVLYVHEPDNPRAISYAWADPAAVRVGINLRNVQGSCKLAEDPFSPAAFEPTAR